MIRTTKQQQSANTDGEVQRRQVINQTNETLEDEEKTTATEKRKLTKRQRPHSNPDDISRYKTRNINNLKNSTSDNIIFYDAQL